MYIYNHRCSLAEPFRSWSSSVAFYTGIGFVDQEYYPICHIASMSHLLSFNLYSSLLFLCADIYPAVFRLFLSLCYVHLCCRDILDARAANPPFNTTTTQEADERYNRMYGHRKIIWRTYFISYWLCCKLTFCSQMYDVAEIIFWRWWCRSTGVILFLCV